jgi:hypothetical protein
MKRSGRSTSPHHQRTSPRGPGSPQPKLTPARGTAKVLGGLDLAFGAAEEPNVPAACGRLEVAWTDMLCGAADADPQPLLRATYDELVAEHGPAAAAKLVERFCRARLLRRPATLVDAGGAPAQIAEPEQRLRRRRVFDMQAQLRLALAGVDPLAASTNDPLTGTAYRELKKVLQLLGVQLGIDAAVYSVGRADEAPGGAAEAAEAVVDSGAGASSAPPAPPAGPPSIAEVRSIAQYVRELLRPRYGDSWYGAAAGRTASLPLTLQALSGEFDDDLSPSASPPHA